MASPAQRPPDLNSIRNDGPLVFFMEDRMRPIVDRVTGEPSPVKIDRRYVDAELLEAFLWLHVGVEIEYFPLQSARRLVYEYFPLFLKALEEVKASPFFETWFTPDLRNLLSRELSGQIGLFSSEATTRRENATRTFQSQLMLSNGFVRRDDSRPFLQAITVTSLGLWEDFLESKSLPVSFVAEEPEAELTNGHWAMAGVFAGLQFMEAIRQSKLPAIEEDSPVAHIDGFARELREVQQWRLNFADYDYRTKFMKAVDVAGQNVIPVCSEPEDEPPADRRQFHLAVEDLARDWGYPLAMSAGGVG